jgi:hypothetical protein
MGITMNSITAQTSPIYYIKKATEAKNDEIMASFIKGVKKLYQYEIFKPLLDLAATKAMQELLKFKVENRKFFELDNGNCRTIQGSLINQFLNQVREANRYVISIKKVEHDIIIHEIAHMIEDESEISLNKNFVQIIHKDISTAASKNLSLQSAIKSLMIDELEHYPKAEHTSELFARYFQLLASAKEVTGHASRWGFSIFDVYRNFPNTEKWMWEKGFQQIVRKIDLEISTKSQSYIKNLKDIDHSWSEKVSSIHGQQAEAKSANKAGKGRVKWSNVIKSIKDTDF